ncbi:MAG: transglutaminase-like domain-containing protein [Elusimicrobiota bacterium]
MEYLNFPTPQEISLNIIKGNLKFALRLIEDWLSKKTPYELKLKLIYEKERIKRLPHVFYVSEKKAFENANKNIRGFTREDFYEVLEKNKCDYVLIEGRKKFEKRFYYNISFAFKKYKNNIKISEERILAKKLLEKRLERLIAGEPPKIYKIRAKISLKVKKTSGDKVRVWLPFPKKGLEIVNVKLISSSHKNFYISPNSFPQRTIYFEGRDDDNFFVEFEYIIKEWINKVDPSKVNESDIKDFINEEPPHIVFSNHLKKMTKEIVGKEKNPYMVAKKIYDFITLNVNYSYVRPYMFYDNISEYVASNFKGDCGFQAILFITMLRIAGVPARWQSGWFITPYFASPHDWALFYIKPYGWLPADLSFGGARRSKEEFRKFYFGNLDGFRMVANDDFMKDFKPAKKFFRSDPCDNQIGEVENKEKNIYDFNYRIKIISFKNIMEAI